MIYKNPPKGNALVSKNTEPKHAGFYIGKYEEDWYKVYFNSSVKKWYFYIPGVKCEVEPPLKWIEYV